MNKRTLLAWGTVLTAALSAAITVNAADIKEHTIRMPVVNPAEHPQALGARKFAELVEKKSGGKIKVKVFPGGSLGPEQQVVSAMQGGTVETSVVGSAQLVGIVKEMLLLDFPFVFANEKEADFVLDGPVGRKLLDKLPEKNLVGLCYMEHGFRSVSNSKRPIAKVEDFQGLKIRTVQNPLYLDMVNALGANAVAMPFTELYTALETRTVDGQENPFSTLDASKFYEIQKYMSTTKHIYNPHVMLVGKKFWDTLSADEKSIFQDACNEARGYQRAVNRQAEQKSRETVIKHGVQVNDLAPQELARMRERVKPVIDKYTAQIGEPLVKEFYGELDKVRKAH